MDASTVPAGVDLLLGALDAHLNPQLGPTRSAAMGIPSREQTAPGHGEPAFVPLRWQARPWLLALGVAALLPELAIWSTAAMQALGLGRPYAAVAALMPPPDAALALRRAVGWSLTLVAPALAAMLSFLAYVDLEVRMARGEVSGRLRFAPSPTPGGPGAAGRAAALRADERPPGSRLRLGWRLSALVAY
jgi:hypothetical protein